MQPSPYNNVHSVAGGGLALTESIDHVQFSAVLSSCAAVHISPWLQYCCHVPCQQNQLLLRLRLTLASNGIVGAFFVFVPFLHWMHLLCVGICRC
jgi:hypothetical protein